MTGAAERKGCLLIMLLAAAAALAGPAHSRSDPTVTIGIGDKAEQLAARAPILGPYLAAIRAEVEGAQNAGREAAREMEKCRKQNAGLVARGRKARDCDEEFAFDPSEVHEPAMALRAALAYRDGKTAFDVPDVTVLRLKGADAVREIAADFGPMFRDVPDVMRHFEVLRTRAEIAAAAIDKSGLPRYRDQGSGPRRLANEIFSFPALRRDLEETQLTDELRTRCGGKSNYLLGAWASDGVYALLLLTGEQDSDVLGDKAGTDGGFRLRLVVADNALVGGRFRPVDSWDHALPLVPPMEWEGLSPVANPMVVVVRTDEEWSTLWKAIGKFSPCASFKGYFAVAVFLGVKPTIGYHVEWTTPPAETYNVVSYRVKENPAFGRGAFQPYAVRRFPYAGGQIRVEATQK